MTFGDAVKYLTSGKAAKRSSWSGYVVKTVASGAPDGDYVLTFKNKGGTTYVYSWDESENKFTAPGDLQPAQTNVPYDGDIMAAMIADDWITGLASDFEVARGSSGTW